MISMALNPLILLNKKIRAQAEEKAQFGPCSRIIISFRLVFS